jgi:hypothetical protein
VLQDVKYLQLPTMSNLCGGADKESFVTFSPTAFYPHNSSDLNLTLVGSSFWGVRDVRVVLEVCDSECLVCGSGGCLECKGMLQLSAGRCVGCPPGYGYDASGGAGASSGSSSATATNTTSPTNTTANNTTTNTTTNTPGCVSCSSQCLSCNFSLGQPQCLLCSAPFFLYQGTCTPRTNIGTPTNTSTNKSSTNNTNNNNTTNNTTSNPFSTASTLNCSLSLPSPSGSSTTDFTFTQTNLTALLALPQPHYKAIVEFYLLRIGQWQPSDRVDVYLNDLLVLSKTFPSYGNKFCSANATDYLSFESLQLVDSNTSLSVFLEVVTGTGQPRTFGVGSLTAYP